MATPTKLKTQAQVAVPQSRDEAADAIFKIGAAQRDLKRLDLEYETITAEWRAAHQPMIDAIKTRIDDLSGGVQTWCEANRDAITESGKVKFANLTTGEINWRQRPPSVKTRATAQLFEKLKRLGFGWMVRSKEELDKEAILNKPTEAFDAGIEISTGIEDFIITPFERDLAA